MLQFRPGTASGLSREAGALHTAACSKAIDNDPQRGVDVMEYPRPEDRQNVRLNESFREMMRDFWRCVSNDCQPGVNITSANIRTTKDRKAICLFDVDVSDTGSWPK